MVAKEIDGVDSFLFGGDHELMDFRCFRGDRADVSPEEIKKQVHSAFMQRKMKRAVISAEPPKAPAAEPQSVQAFVADLAKSC